MGPIIQYSTEKPADPIELRVYTGENADFDLYEDENDNYNYENGKYAVIPMHWDDKALELTVGERTGGFHGMLVKRSFQIVFVGKDHGCGIRTTKNADKLITYTGEKITVHK
jgi:alpha-D-xyloside xylohydrolase